MERESCGTKDDGKTIEDYARERSPSPYPLYVSSRALRVQSEPQSPFAALRLVADAPALVIEVLNGVVCNAALAARRRRMLGSRLCPQCHVHAETAAGGRSFIARQSTAVAVLMASAPLSSTRSSSIPLTGPTLSL
jgi:hypothetical protein